MNLGILYIVATPIGNLKDMTFRAVETLEKVDLIVCEDTRQTKKLLEHYRIVTLTQSFYGKGSGARKPVPKLDFFLQELQAGKNLAMVTDAGTPGIADPGNQLVAKAIENGIMVVPVPGASALTALVSVAGIDLSQFLFLGFPPHKKGRETFFKEVAAVAYPVFYFESPYRLIKNLELLNSLASEKNIILGKELTKMFEEIVRGTVPQVLEYFQNHPDKIKGEFVIIVY